MAQRGKQIAEFIVRKAVTVTALCFAFYVNALSATHPSIQQTPAPLQAPAITTKEKATLKGFDDRVKAYIKLRESVKSRLPKLSKDSTPEQIESYRKTFAEQMRQARAGVKNGDLFRASVAAYIRKTLRTEFQGKDRAELRDIVFDEETAGVPLRVNYPYPEQKEFTEMPATLLAKLPPLPKELRYRFVGRNLLLVDRDNILIIDYMVDALP
jgi:hypothetical protein